MGLLQIIFITSTSSQTRAKKQNKKQHETEIKGKTHPIDKHKFGVV